MLYWFLKPLAQITFQVFFRKLYYLHEEKVPKKGPVVLVTNHPTAFLDPIVYPTFGKRAAYNVLRGDMFSTPFSEWLCRQIKTIPIFRFRDGFENMRKNQEIMDEIAGHLKKGKVLSVMIEGSHEHGKRLRTVQKGAARMVFHAYEKYGDMDIQLVPLAVNYTDSDKFRSVAMAEFGEPIALRDYLELYEKSSPRAIKMLTKEIETRLRQHIIHIANEADEPFVNTLLDMNRNDFDIKRFPIFDRKNEALLRQEMAICDQINALPEDKKTYIREDIEGYEQRLDRLTLQDIGVAQSENYSIKNTLLLLLGFLPFLLGYVLNVLPVWYASYFADKNIKKIEFHSSIRFGIGTIGYFLYYLLWIVVAVIIQQWWFIALVIAMPFLGFFTLFYRDFYHNWKAARAFKHLPIDEANSIREQRKNVLAFRKEVG